MVNTGEDFIFAVTGVGQRKNSLLLNEPWTFGFHAPMNYHLNNRELCALSGHY